MLYFEMISRDPTIQFSGAISLFVVLILGGINSLPNNKNLDWAKLKAFADSKINMTQKLKLKLGWVENIVGKRENAGYRHLFLFPQCFQKVSYSGSLKVMIVW